jgi:GH15 family glucan-1,4-alpha-glucosidase
MCGVALDRLLDMHRAGDLQLSAARTRRFQQVSGEIHRAVEQHGWCEAHGSYVSRFGGEDVDASLLLLPLYGFLEADDPKVWATFERIRRELGRDGLLMRYPRDQDDGLPAGEGAFGICSFWAAEYLARSGRPDEAERAFEKLCSYANELGLFSEEIDPRNGTALGNFPQAFTHVGLVSAALAIGEARGARPPAGLEGSERRERPGRSPGAHAAEDLHAGDPR